MRILRICSFYFRAVIDSKAENFVYFLIAFINPIASLIYWNGAYAGSSLATLGWTLPEITTYYMLLITGGSMVMSHVEWVVAFEDIYKGNLSHFLLKPFSYVTLRLFSELPWRLFQGSFGIIFIFCFVFFFRGNVAFVAHPLGVLSALIIIILAFFISFLFKMIIGLTALWTTDYWGMQQLVEVGIIVLGGFVLPLSLFPDGFRDFVLGQPFAYVIYFPLLSVIGKIPLSEIPGVIAVQLFWITVFTMTYLLVWRAGIKKYVGVGN